MLDSIYFFGYFRRARKKSMNTFITGEIIGEKIVFPQLRGIQEAVTEDVL